MGLLAIRRNPLRVSGVETVVMLILFAIAAPVIAPRGPTTMSVSNRLAPPSRHLLMGGDEIGRDVWARVVYGARISLSVSLVTVAIALPIGTLLGVAAGFFRGHIDVVAMRAMDMLLAFPPLLLALFVTAMLGPSLRNAMIAMGIVSTPGFARVARGSTLSIRELDFIEAAAAVGASPARIIWTHILPNIAPMIIVQSTLTMAWAILTEAALSFLGLGVQPPMPSWGGMLSQSRSYMEIAPWTAFFPGLAIVISVLGFSLFGDALRDLLDPRLRI